MINVLSTQLLYPCEIFSFFFPENEFVNETDATNFRNVFFLKNYRNNFSFPFLTFPNFILFAK